MASTELKKFDRMPQSIPLPSHRHAIPSGPWPWMDLDSEETSRPQKIPSCQHEGCDICRQWLGYPQSHSPNWTPDQVARCNITPAIEHRQHNCKIYHVDVKDDQGLFAPCDREGRLVTKENQREFWEWLQVSVSDLLWKVVLSSSLAPVATAGPARESSLHREPIWSCSPNSRSLVSR